MLSWWKSFLYFYSGTKKMTERYGIRTTSTGQSTSSKQEFAVSFRYLILLGETVNGYTVLSSFIPWINTRTRNIFIVALIGFLISSLDILCYVVNAIDCWVFNYSIWAFFHRWWGVRESSLQSRLIFNISACSYFLLSSQRLEVLNKLWSLFQEIHEKRRECNQSISINVVIT